MITKEAYIRYVKASMFSSFIGCVVWVSLGTFMLMAKNSIGINNIPIFEAVVFISHLLGIVYVYRTQHNLKDVILLSLIVETLFLISIYIALIYYNIAFAGVAVYMVIMVNAYTNLLTRETKRTTEDKVLKSQTSKRLLRILRKKLIVIESVAGAIGTLIALIVITYYNVDILIFTKIILLLNVLSNLYDYYVWNKYLN